MERKTPGFESRCESPIDLFRYLVPSSIGLPHPKTNISYKFTTIRPGKRKSFLPLPGTRYCSFRHLKPNTTWA